MSKIDYCTACETLIVWPRVALARGSGEWVRGWFLCPPCGWAEGMIDVLMGQRVIKIEINPRELEGYKLPNPWDIWLQFWDEIRDGEEYEAKVEEYAGWAKTQTENVALSLSKEVADIPNVGKKKVWSWNG